MQCNFRHLQFVSEEFSISSGYVIIMRYCWIKKTLPFNQIYILVFNIISILIYHFPMSTTMKRISCKVVSYFICNFSTKGTFLSNSSINRFIKVDSSPFLFSPLFMSYSLNSATFKPITSSTLNPIDVCGVPEGCTNANDGVGPIG